MAYEFKTRARWVICNQEPNELFLDLHDFLDHKLRIWFMDDEASVRDARIRSSRKETAIQKWCERRNIKLEWIGRPQEVRPYSPPPIRSFSWNMEQYYLLSFETPSDALLFKLHFNSDSKVDD